MQGIANARRDMSDLRSQLVATAMAAASPTQNTLASAREVALALSHIPSVRDLTPGCNADVTSAQRGVPFLDNIARFDATGHIACSALPRALGLKIRDDNAWQQAQNGTDFIVTGVTESRSARRPVIVGLLPMRDYAGRFQGTLNVLIDLRWLTSELKDSPLPAGSVMAIFDRDRNMIASTNATVAQALFRAGTARPDANVAVRTGQDASGMSWTYASAPLLGPNIFVGFAMPDTRLFGAAYTSAVIDFILPFAMILLTWAAIWIVTDRQVTRWIIYLRRVSAAYRSGHYNLRPTLEGAPSELRRLGDAMAEMAVAISDRDRSLREAVAQKTLLIKEIHHRVKNNLQVVISLLSLQSKRLKDPSAQEALADMRTRVNALALVHRLLYEIDDQSTVDVKRLIEQLCEQASEGFGAERRDVHVIVDIMPCEISSEMAVPLALFTVEALTNAFKHAFPAGRGGVVHVTLACMDEARLRLTIVDNGVGFEPPGSSTSIGARLIRTFGQQIGGTAQIRSRAGEGTCVELVFTVPALTPAAKPNSR